MRDEEKFPTVRFLKCKECGQVYTGSLTGENACPKCHAPAPFEASLSPSLRKETDGRHVAFFISGPLHKIQELEDLKVQIDISLAKEIESIAFVFEASSYLDSSIIGLMVKTMQSLSLRGKATYVITEDSQVLESLQLLDLDRVMKVFASIDQYRAAIKKPS